MPLVNVSLELSRSLLPLTERQRAFQLTRILEEIILAADSPVVLLDNIELLFAPALKQDPLRVLQSLARSHALVAAWRGRSRRGTSFTDSQPPRNTTVTQSRISWSWRS